MSELCKFGNPGSKYHQTRHRVGYMVLDEFDP